MEEVEGEIGEVVEEMGDVVEATPHRKRRRRESRRRRRRGKGVGPGGAGVRLLGSLKGAVPEAAEGKVSLSAAVAGPSGPGVLPVPVPAALHTPVDIVEELLRGIPMHAAEVGPEPRSP